MTNTNINTAEQGYITIEGINYESAGDSYVGDINGWVAVLQNFENEDGDAVRVNYTLATEALNEHPDYMLDLDDLDYSVAELV